MSTLQITFTEEFLTQYLADQAETFMTCEFRGRLIRIRIVDVTPPGPGPEHGAAPRDVSVEQTQRCVHVRACVQVCVCVETKLAQEGKESASAEKSRRLIVSGWNRRRCGPSVPVLW